MRAPKTALTTAGGPTIVRRQRERSWRCTPAGSSEPRNPVVIADVPGRPEEPAWERVAIFRPTDGAERDDALRSYLREIGGIPLLSASEEQVIAQCAATGDRRARERLVEANLRLVVTIARTYARSRVPLIDLIQEGNLGLMHASEKFDWRLGYRFGTYAGWWIRQAISRAAGEQAHIIHLPQRVAARLYRLRRIAARLALEGGGQPSVEQIAHAAGMPQEEVEDLMGIVAQPTSLDDPGDDADHPSLADTLSDPAVEDPAEVVSRHAIGDELGRALEQLNARQREVLVLHFGITNGRARTLREVGGMLHLSCERVRQIEHAALAVLREATGATVRGGSGIHAGRDVYESESATDGRAVPRHSGRA